MSYPRPTRLASTNNLKAVWLRSKDNRHRGRATGIDGIRPEQLNSRLDESMARVRQRMLSPNFGFHLLRANFILKDKGGIRVICVPTVEDRLIQRAALEYLNKGDKLAVRNNVSYGFHAGSGVEKAVRAARNIRKGHRWALKSDIHSFFNQIRRDDLKQDVARKLGNRSVVPLLFSAIDTEIKLEGRGDEKRLTAAGIKKGLGLRQGMPLSPILSNVVLRDFDKGIVRANLNMVRYADDFVIFCDSESECESALHLVTKLLGERGHTVPSLGPDSKTMICAPHQPIEFLGFDITPEGNTYKVIAPPRAMDRVIELCAPFRSFATCQEEWITLGVALQSLKAKLSSFANSYRIATNFGALKSHTNNCKRETITRLLTDFLGVDVVQSLSEEELNFLDIGSDDQ